MQDDSQITVMSTSGVVLRAGDDCASRVGRTRDEVTGRHVSEFCHPALVGEFLPTLTKHATDGSPFLAAVMLGGNWSMFLFRPRQATGDTLEYECFTERDWRSIEYEVNGIPFYKFRYRDLGPLATLTQRELEVLKLIGDGLTTKQMSQILHRSERTIQGHRISLGKKLGCRTKADLARVATDAGLPGTQLHQLNRFLS